MTVNDSGIEEPVSEKGFWNKVKKSARFAGRETVGSAVTLFHTMRDKDTPTWAKTVIGGALAYFVLPTDMVPDFLPGGYVDDWATLLSAMVTLRANIKDEHRERANAWARKWFGDSAKSIRKNSRVEKRNKKNKRIDQSDASGDLRE